MPLAERGFEMTGIDVCDSRLERCREALEKRVVSASVRHSDMRSLTSSESYDAILAIDSVPNYLLEDEAILDFLRRLRGALRPDGLLLLDIWNMLAQREILDRPIISSETRLGDLITFREVHHLDSLRGRMHIHLHATVSGSDGQQHEIDHEEVLRIVTPAEMRMLLQAAGFARVSIYPHHEQLDEPADNPEALWFLAN